jgi:6-pyruvoyltetrahydropterin/6-carboxytetrahydropterin synthase
VHFSAAHNFWLDALSEADNRAVFGSTASPWPHGHDYRVELTVEGGVCSNTGMVVNLANLDALLRERVVNPLNGTWLNKQVPEFGQRPPSLEVLAPYLYARLAEGVGPLTITRLRLVESPYLSLDYLPHEEEKMLMTRRYDFCAAHRLHNPALSDEENVAIFGSCNNPYGHGHNYVLEVTLAGSPDPVTGLMLDLDTLDRVVHEEVVEVLDHRYLNVEVPEFHDLVPTTENLCRVIWDRLVGKVPGRLHKVGIHETPNNFFEYVGDE